MVYQSQAQSEAQLEKEMMEQLCKIGYEELMVLEKQERGVLKECLSNENPN